MDALDHRVLTQTPAAMMAPKLPICAMESSQILGLARTLDQLILGVVVWLGVSGREPEPQHRQQTRHGAGDHEDVVPTHRGQQLRDAVDHEAEPQQDGTAIDPLGPLDFFAGKKVGTYRAPAIKAIARADPDNEFQDQNRRIGVGKTDQNIADGNDNQGQKDQIFGPELIGQRPSGYLQGAVGEKDGRGQKSRQRQGNV